MKLQIIHLSDMHFKFKENAFSINIDKMLQALDTIEKADECVIVISGDLAATGSNKEYNYVSSLLGAILKTIAPLRYAGHRIEIVCVPGNHDIDFSKEQIAFEDVKKANECNCEYEFIHKYLDKMSSFYRFAQNKNCYKDDLVVSKKVVEYDKTKIGFVMLNTAPFSVLGGDYLDMGFHYLTDEQMKSVEEATEADINIIVMHHSMEWFRSDCKDRLRRIVSKKYSLILTGHEHVPIGECRNINGQGDLLVVQGNALFDEDVNENGFCTINIDMHTFNMVGYSFVWKNDVYVPDKIFEQKVREVINSYLTAKKSFLDCISIDGYKHNIDDYYVFPGMSYNIVEDENKLKHMNVETEDELVNLIKNFNRIVINGEHKSGKTIIAKRLFKKFLKLNKIPIYINANDINKRKFDKTLEYAFMEQYEEDNNAIVKFKQLKKDKKVILLDDANLISKKTFDIFLTYLESNAERIIIFSEEKIDLNIKKQVVDAMVDGYTLQIDINPFLYTKRKMLISNVLKNGCTNNEDIEVKTKKINEIINMQVKYFQLNPEFIINFVNQYEHDYRFQFSSGMNVFDIVYENSVKNRILENSENIDATLVINVLRELAYYMHFNRKKTVCVSEVEDVIGDYSRNYRQKVNVMLFLESATRAKVLNNVNNQIRFNDHTLVAYFVAQALNQKYNQGEDIQEDFDCLLKNLCFSINSDIVLFLALITNNPKFVNLIVEGARSHFKSHEELSFDKENVKFLLETSIKVKNSLPTKKEIQQREKVIDKQEEKVKLSELVELVNEYDYSDEDLKSIESQIMISFKYLEIISKALPAFCQNMKVEQQDKLVELIYKCPNQFLYMILKDIGDNFEDFCNELYDEISLLRKEKDIANVSMDSVKSMIEQICGVFIMALYRLVAITCTSEQSIAALNAFEFDSNSNYKLQNLMMISKEGGLVSFSKRAKELEKEAKYKLEKSIIKYTVREYFLQNKIDMHGEAQSLFDYFFDGKSNQKLQSEIAKRKIVDKDRT